MIDKMTITNEASTDECDLNNSILIIHRIIIRHKFALTLLLVLFMSDFPTQYFNSFTVICLLNRSKLGIQK